MKNNRYIFASFYIVAAVCLCIYAEKNFLQPVSQYKQTIEKLEYQLGYTEVYSSKVPLYNSVEAANNTDSEKKVVYLTFDDGPSGRTEEILDILKEYNIKATFFIIYNQNEYARELVKRTYDEGHTIGVHSTTHSYKEIYKSVDAFLKDFKTCFDYIEEITGQPPSIFRFPGGSVNSYNKAVRKDIAAEMQRRGFVYFDWNVCSDDATGSYSEESIYQKVVEGCRERNSSVVLMHDSARKAETVAALKRIIPKLLEEGYSFKALDENVNPVVFRME